MTTFKFRLQSVLEYRRTLVDQVRMELAQAELRAREAEETLQALRASEQAALGRLGELQTKPQLNIAAVSHLLEHLQQAAERIAQQQVVVDQCRQTVDQVQAKLVELARDAKALEKLRERHVEAHATEEVRLERIESSELAARQYRHQQRVPPANSPNTTRATFVGWAVR